MQVLIYIDLHKTIMRHTRMPARQNGFFW